MTVIPQKICVADQTIDCGAYTVKITNALQAKYIVKHLAYASTSHCYFYERTGSNTAGSLKFDIIYTTNMPGVTSKNILLKGLAFRPGEAIAAGHLYFSYNANDAGASSIVKDMNSVYKSLKVASNLKFIKFNKNKFKGWKQAIYQSLLSRNFSNGNFNLDQYSAYKIAYINNDTIPEIILATNANSAYSKPDFRILCYYKNKVILNVVSNLFGRVGYIYFSPKKSRLLLRAQTEKWYQDVVYYYSKGTLKAKKWGTFISEAGVLEKGTNFNWSNSINQSDIKTTTKAKYINSLHKVMKSNNPTLATGYITRDRLLKYLLYGVDVYAY